MHPVMNSRDVIMADPIKACSHIGMSQGITSFIAPTLTKQIPPRKNIVQCVFPLHANSMHMYNHPPIPHNIKFLTSCFNGILDIFNVIFQYL